MALRGKGVGSRFSPHARDSAASGPRCAARQTAAVAVADRRDSGEWEKASGSGTEIGVQGERKNRKPKARRTWTAAALIGPVPGWHPGAKAMEAGGGWEKEEV